MKISAVNSTQTNINSKKSNLSFNARIGLYDNVIPYLRRQASYMAAEKNPDIATKWANETWSNVMKIGERFKKVLRPDTPIVMAADSKAIRSVVENQKVYNGLDGMLVLDGRAMFTPPELIPVLEHYTQPVPFKFGTDSNLADKLAEKFDKIPLEIADLFKPHF